MDLSWTAFSANYATILAVLWSLAWKAYAIWLAAKSERKRWFLVLLILNTFGILEIIYVFYIEKKTWQDIKNVLSQKI